VSEVHQRFFSFYLRFGDCIFSRVLSRGLQRIYYIFCYEIISEVQRMLWGDLEVEGGGLEVGRGSLVVDPR